MKAKILSMFLFLCCMLTLSAQTFPYLSGPGIDIGTYAKMGVEQTYKVKYSFGNSTETQNQLVKWEVDPNQCDVIAKHGKTASITLKWKVSGVKGSIKAHTVYTTEGFKDLSSGVDIESTSIGNISITAPDGALVDRNIIVNVNTVDNIIGNFRLIVKGTDFVKTEEGNKIVKGLFTSPGLKTITATIYNEKSQKVAETTKSITVLPNSITGNDALALNSPMSYSLINAPNGNYTWTVSNNLRILSGQGSSRIELEAISGSIREGNISVSAFGVTLSKKVALGIPDTKFINVTLGYNNTLYAYHTNRNECRATYKGSGTILEYDWRSTSWEVFNPLTPNKSIVFLKSLYTPASSTANILVRARNDVGWSDYLLLGAQVNNTISGSTYNIRSLKNGTITITKNEQENSTIVMNGNNQDRINPTYELYNQFTGVIVKKGKLANIGGQINVSDLPKGIYIISLIFDSSNRQTEKIIIQH